MEEQLVNFNTAILAKEKAFNWTPKYLIEVYDKEDENLVLLKIVDYYKNSDICILAPTQTLLQKWLREIHNIDVFIIPVRFTGYLEIGYYTYSIKGEQPVGKEKYKFDTWEEALEVALEKGLKLIE